MKYSPSTRFINIIINVLLLVGFGFLGIWFAFFVTPNLLTSSQPMPGVKLPEMGVGLSALLASLGIAGTIVALCGTIFELGAFFKGNNDDLVRKTFSCYIALGYVISTFFFLNAILFYRLTSTNFDESLDLAFVIAVYAVLTILAMIATNVPLLHMYGEGEHTNQIMKTVTGGVLAIDLAVALVFGTLYLANLGNRGRLREFQRRSLQGRHLRPSPARRRARRRRHDGWLLDGRKEKRRPQIQRLSLRRTLGRQRPLLDWRDPRRAPRSRKQNAQHLLHGEGLWGEIQRVHGILHDGLHHRRLGPPRRDPRRVLHGLPAEEGHRGITSEKEMGRQARRPIFYWSVFKSGETKEGPTRTNSVKQDKVASSGASYSGASVP